MGNTFGEESDLEMLKIQSRCVQRDRPRLWRQGSEAGGGFAGGVYELGRLNAQRDVVPDDTVVVVMTTV